jgi:hypothetical protein
VEIRLIGVFCCCAKALMEQQLHIGIEGVFGMALESERILAKLEDIDQKVSALLVKEEKPSKEELAAIRAGKKEFEQKKFKSWNRIKAQTE